jgi:LuxR family transcriptional regulator, quorum-sensing system regulator CinR
MAIDQPNEEKLARAYSIIENTPEMDKVVDRLRDILDVDHVVYSLARPPAGLYIHLTYPASWIKQYINRGYADVDPIAREGSQRSLPFDWNELTILSSADSLFLADAHSHGIGLTGFPPLSTKYGNKALFSISSSRSEGEWRNFLATIQPTLIQVASRLHRRAVVEVFGEDLL